MKYENSTIMVFSVTYHSELHSAISIYWEYNINQEKSFILLYNVQIAYSTFASKTWIPD